MNYAAIFGCVVGLIAAGFYTSEGNNPAAVWAGTSAIWAVCALVAERKR